MAPLKPAGSPVSLFTSKPRRSGVVEPAPPLPAPINTLAEVPEPAGWNVMLLEPEVEMLRAEVEVMEPPFTAKVPAVTTSPVLPDTVKLEVSTAIPPLAFMRPVVVMVSPEFTGLRSVPVLLHQPWVPELAVVAIAPEQVRLPVAPSAVQPVAAEPPRKSMVEAVAAPGPMLKSAVAAPPRFMVVAVVLRRSKLVWLVDSVVVPTKDKVEAPKAMVPSEALEMVSSF